MGNQDTEVAWRYHNTTKHSYWSVRNNPNQLDWGNKPAPFKIYHGLETIPINSDTDPSGVSAFRALHLALSLDTNKSVPDLADLASLLFFTAGVTKRRKYAGGEILYRAAACTGALYEIDLYIICGNLHGLSTGVYHFNPRDFLLHRMREGDYREILVEATAGESAIAEAPLVIVCSGTYWRNAWKYQARTYRHFGWDGGTLLANLLAIATARRLPARIVSGFIDKRINSLLYLDPDREVALSLVAIGSGSGPAGPAPLVKPLHLETVPLSHSEIAYPIMREIHTESSLHSLEEIRTWRQTRAHVGQAMPTGILTDLNPIGMGNLPRESLEDVIRRRGSSRKFARKPINLRQLATILHVATRGIHADFLEPFGSRLNTLYIIAHAVDGLAPGSYVFRPESSELELLTLGNFRDTAGYLGLEQQLPADASAVIFFAADLRHVLECYGNRGYRIVQLEAGLIGGRIYLAAYAQRLGASGLTFYDDEVVRFFSPHAEGKSAIFLVTVGRGIKVYQSG